MYAMAPVGIAAAIATDIGRNVNYRPTAPGRTGHEYLFVARAPVGMPRARAGCWSAVWPMALPFHWRPGTGEGAGGRLAAPVAGIGVAVPGDVHHARARGM